jgi:hypothetical protein
MGDGVSGGGRCPSGDGIPYRDSRRHVVGDGDGDGS